MSPKRIRLHVNPLSILKEHTFCGFGNANPIVVDVGCAKGEFATSLIEKKPQKNYLLFEIRTPLCRKLCEQFAETQNVAVFDGDAGRNLKTILQPCLEQGAAVETIYVNFPDPWFKERHKKRRFINQKFLEEMSEVLPPETEFIFQTDQEGLFRETIEVVENSPFSQIEFFDASPHGIQTDWEAAKMAEGERIWRMKFKKPTPKGRS